MTALALSSPAERAAYEQGMSDALSLAEAVAAVPMPLVTLGAEKAITLDQLASAIAQVDPAVLRILKPFDRREAFSVGEAAGAVGVSESAVRSWATRYGIGRLMVGSLLISRPALAMLADDDAAALVAYLRGDRQGLLVAPYFARAGLSAAV